MRELFHLVDKYNFTAPLAALSDDFDLKHYLRLCDALDVSEVTQQIISPLFLALMKIDEQTASLKFLGEAIGKTDTALRRNLKALEKHGLVKTEYITTDKVKRRRGVLLTLCIPSLTMQDSQAEQGSGELQMVPHEQVSQISAPLLEFEWRLMSILVTRYLVKAMRTNKKDKSKDVSVRVSDRKGDDITIHSVAESNRLMYVKDIAYYAGAITWLYFEVSSLVERGQPIPETYTLPIDRIVSLGKNIPLSEASSGGYIDNAIEALKRTSATSFELSDLPFYLRSLNLDAKLEFYSYKMFRVEAIVSYNDHGSVKKAVRMQFPKTTIDSIVWSIENKRPFDQLTLIDGELFNSLNEIEILFGLWARDQYSSNPSFDRSYSWNELREVIAPGSELSEFKRKFSNLIAENADPGYSPKVSDAAVGKVSETTDNVVYTATGRNRSVLYARATVQGFLINVGFSDSEKAARLYFRKDLSGLVFTQSRIGESLRSKD